MNRDLLLQVAQKLICMCLMLMKFIEIFVS